MKIWEIMLEFFNGQSESLRLILFFFLGVDLSRPKQPQKRPDGCTEMLSAKVLQVTINHFLQNISRIYDLVISLNRNLCLCDHAIMYLSSHFPHRPPGVNVGHKVREAPLSQRSLFLVVGPGPRRRDPPKRRPGPLSAGPRM